MISVVILVISVVIPVIPIVIPVISVIPANRVTLINAISRNQHEMRNRPF